MMTIIYLQVLTVPEIFNSHLQDRNPSILSITYHHIPISRENAPEHAELEKMGEILRSIDPTTAIIFNCQVITELT